ncbi:MAG TPA: molybdopterin cofactor-binding domain-containing protein [Streptosporangiaceae bacterium]|nr:molybdopterin cofactor-binding domain-containing protein [Streptosporangiaceae bacterium]
MTVVAGRLAGRGRSGSSAVVNGKPCELGGPPGRSLLALLRSDLGLTGVKPGCGEGQCGACTVLVDGAPVLACQTTLAEVAGRAVTTIEGLASGGRLHPVQQALAEEQASQCGYCTPGMALRAAALLAADDNPGQALIRAALEPNVCRCGCYPRIVRAVCRVAGLLRGPAQQAPEAPPDGVPPLARPRRPWDLCPPSEREWFDILGDGLVVVWPAPAPAAGRWPAGGGAWVHVDPSGRVTAFTGKVDVGQDNQTAFRLLVAEELATRPDDVQVVQGDTDLCPFDIGTFGSRSMPDGGEPLRRAAAGARQVLLGLAAQRWGSEAVGLVADEGAIAGGPGRARLAYGELVAGLRRLEVLSAEPPLTRPSAWRVAGRSGHAAPRADAVTGGRRFVSDLVLPGMLHGAVLRPPVPGSVLRAVDTAAAGKMAGVTVVCDGQFIGVVAADPASARRAVAAVRSDWERPPAGPAEMAGYLRGHPAAGQGWERPVDRSEGDTEAALGGAATRVQASYTTAYLAHVPLETRAAVAAWDGGRLTVWTGCNVPFAVRGQLADAFGIGQADVRVIVPPTGGGFGGKHGEEAVEAARLARAAGRPVKVHWSRAEEFGWGYLRPMAVIDVRAGLDASGTITAWDFLDINAGAQGTAFPYATASWRLRYQPAASPLAQGPYRALAATANTFARESCLDELAHAAGADPLQFRLDHLADQRLAIVVRTAAARFGWAPARGRGTPPGWGIAAGLEKDGRVATCAEVRAGPDGQLSVTRIVTAYECGAIVNPDTVAGQVEGGTIMALGGALFEQVILDHGALASPSLADYRVPRFSDVPDIDVVLVDRPDIAPAGAGETPLIAVAPAVANAIFAATGRRLRSLPLIPAGRLPAGQ